MPSRPTLVLAMRPDLPAKLFDERLWARLDRACRLLGRSPLVDLDSPAARSRLADAEILLTGWGCPRVDAAVLEQAPALRAVVHAAGSVKGHLSPSCWRRGLQVSSAAAANAVPVAEYTVAAILFANKRVLRLRQRYRELRERRDWAAEAPGLGNYGKTVGVVGASRVGRLVIRLLQPYDLRVIVADPHLSEADAGALGVEHVGLDDLLRSADVVSVHAPLLPETRGLLDRRRLALMRDGATLINTARGAIVDGSALTDELVSGRIDAVIDTTDPEPLPADSPLYDLPNVLLTPHIAGSLGTETRRMAALAVEEVERFAGGLPFAHGVALDDLPRLA